MAQRIITRSGTKMIIPTIYGHVVDDSMQNIVSQIEKKARELQAVTEQHDRLMRDNNILINKTEILKQQIKIYEDRIDALSNTKNDVAMKISNNLADYDKRIAEYKKTLSISSETAERLCSLLREIENLLKQPFKLFSRFISYSRVLDTNDFSFPKPSSISCSIK